MGENKKRAIWGIGILLAIAIGWPILFPSNSSTPASGDAAAITPTAHLTYDYAAPTPTPSARLRYYVGVASGADISVTYHNAEGGTEQVDYTGPWDKVITVTPGYFSSLVAQLRDSYASDIACEIQVNGKTIKRSESHAKYGIVTCSGEIE